MVLMAGAAYFVWAHGGGRHGRPNLLCPLCLLEKVDPSPRASGGTSQAEPSAQD